MTTETTVFFPFRRHALALALILASPAMTAATLNVGGTCTLYNAIKNADTDNDTDGVGFGCVAGSGADVINLTPKTLYSLLGAGSEDGLPVINSVMTINGKQSTIDALGLRAFNISSTGNLTLNRLTITKGSALKGGGILNSGKLQLKDSVVTGNTAVSQCDYYCFGSYGGGIYNSGTAVLTNSRISKNIADAGYSINGDNGRGGGIFNNGKMTLNGSTVSQNQSTGSSQRGAGPIGGGIINYGTMTIANSTITSNSASASGGGILNRSVMAIDNTTVSRNQAVGGGGIYNGHFLGIFNNSLTLTNSTVSDNAANGGAGIYNAKNLNLTNTTVSGNKASNSGGGIVNKGVLAITHGTFSANRSASLKGGGLFNLANATLANTVIANSPSGGDCVNSGSGTSILQGVNLVEDGSCGADAGDPKLGLLLDNGGYTETHAIRAKSPALDTANTASCTAKDQRGILRPQPDGGACDVGAFERTATVSSEVSSIVQFFDNAISGGGVAGTGNPGQAAQRSQALRNQLLTAGQLKAQNLDREACSQIKRANTRIDADATPDLNDYVTGIQASGLQIEMASLLNTWACK
jgi:hypothetical protein